jgi:hypothetical protein
MSSQTPKLPGYSQPPTETRRYECSTSGGDTYGQSPPTDATPINQHKQLAGDPMPAKQTRKPGY